MGDGNGPLMLLRCELCGNHGARGVFLDGKEKIICYKCESKIKRGQK